MTEYIESYYKFKGQVDSFIEDSLTNIGSLTDIESKNFDALFNTFRSLELVYVVDANTKVQSSSNIYAHTQDEDAQNHNRSYLIERMEVMDNGFAMTTPYKSIATKNLCITVSKKEGDKIFFMDFDLSKLLERLGLIERHPQFDQIQRTFYLLIGAFMSVIAVAAVLYAMLDFGSHLLASNLDIHTIFKPVIAATLGLAIFDLSKTILEQEVVYKSYVKGSKEEMKLLTKFLFTILIALAIETLMVVFKTAMDEHGEMLNALYLMSGISLIILSLGLFIFFTGKRG